MRPTLYGGGGADDEGLLEGLWLGAELGGAGLHGQAGLGQAWDVDGGVMVQCRLVVQKRHSAPC